MRNKTFSALALLASVQAGCCDVAAESGSPTVAYPVTKRGDVVETHFGKAIADPYRWLENDPRQDKDVAAWTAAQRRTSSAYLETLPGRDAFRKSLASAYNYERISAPQKEGGRYFYTRKNGQRDQAAIVVREGANGRDRVLVDPARWSDDGSVALAEWRASPDGKRLAYAVHNGGSDWRTIKVLDVATGRELADEVQWARFTQIAWAKDGSGFYYSRYPEPKAGSKDGALITDKDAERSKIVTVDLGAPKPVVTDLLPQQDAIMTGATIVGGRLLVAYLVDAKSELRRYKLDGTPDGVVKLPGIGSLNALAGDAQDPEAFFVFASFNTPNTVFRYDVATNQQAVWIEPKIEADLDQIVVNQVFYASKDGARIPMFVVRRKDVSGPAPTLLTGYGAFAISMPPAYSAMLTGWVLQGGVLAIPSIRGGSEYGAAWHAAARREKKQNSFDDFIAAAEYLQAHRIAPVGGIAAYGDSAGGLLIGAVVNQRPELFGAGLPSVGVMDMLRYNRFTGGQLWVGEYGDPAVEADFDNLLSYSPYHNVKTGKPYPAILATTGEADNRVVPAHSFKYVAALQAADPGPRPRLLRIDARAGHGAGKPTHQVIEEAADMWAFAAHWTGLEVAPAR